MAATAGGNGVDLIFGKRILAVGAHPDDVELGCFGTLSRLRATGRDVNVLVMTSGGADLRIAETRAAFAAIGVNPVVTAFVDGQLAVDHVAVMAVEAELLRTRADTVLTMTRWDTHQDHRAVEAMVLAACRRQPITVIGYHVISSTQDFPVHLVVDINPVFEDKLAALRQHCSQADRTYFDAELLRRWHHQKAATAVGLDTVELFHIYQAFWGRG